jgi:hypothetical protein
MKALAPRCFEELGCFGKGPLAEGGVSESKARPFRMAGMGANTLFSQTLGFGLPMESGQKRNRRAQTATTLGSGFSGGDKACMSMLRAAFCGA